MRHVALASFCVFAFAVTSCTKKMGSQSVSGVFSCSVTKGETRQTCTEFKNLTPNEVAYFKQKCDSDSSMDAASWQEAPCVKDARQGGCSLAFSDTASSISTSYVAWGYTATALAAITAPAACEKNGGQVVQP